MGDSKEKSCKYFFGERLRQLRNENGLSQEALAKDLGISKGSLGFYETCKNTPDIEILDAVSKYFDVSLDYLLGRTPNKTANPELKETCEYIGLCEDAIEIIRSQRDSWKQVFSVLCELDTFCLIVAYLDIYYSVCKGSIETAEGNTKEIAKSYIPTAKEIMAFRATKAFYTLLEHLEEEATDQGKQ